MREAFQKVGAQKRESRRKITKTQKQKDIKNKIKNKKHKEKIIVKKNGISFLPPFMLNYGQPLSRMYAVIAVTGQNPSTNTVRFTQEITVLCRGGV